MFYLYVRLCSLCLVPAEVTRGHQMFSVGVMESGKLQSWWWKLNLGLLQVQEVFWRAQPSLYLLFSVFSWGVGEHLFCFPAAFYPIVSMSTPIVVTIDSYKMLPSVFSTFSNKAFPATYPLFFFFLFPGIRFFLNPLILLHYFWHSKILKLSKLEFICPISNQVADF